MHARRIRTRAVQLASPLALSVVLVSACMVGKSKYEEELHARQDCQTDLGQCGKERDVLRARLQDLRQQVEKETRSNSALLEELAALHAAQEENLRKLSVYERQLEERETRIARMTETYDSVIGNLSQEINDGNIRVEESGARLKLNLIDKILFPSGSAKLTPKGEQVLERVGFALKDINDRRIMIEGHTDDVPLTPRLEQAYGSNWGLSAMRAAAVARYLHEKAGMDPRLLGATGYSCYRPYRKNDTAEGRQANRRIEIILSPLTPQEMQELHAASARGEAQASTPAP